MARIRNNPGRYLSRNAKLPAISPDLNSNLERVEERRRKFLDAPIDENFYIDFRVPPRSR